MAAMERVARVSGAKLQLTTASHTAAADGAASPLNFRGARASRLIRATRAAAAADATRCNVQHGP